MVAQMPSFYSVVQYVPDAIRGERINVGVVTFDDRSVKCQFLDNWHRVNNFGKGASFVRTAVADIAKMNVEDLRNTIQGWSHNIQFTEPAGSVLDTNTLLFETCARFLVDPETEPRTYRSRQDAVHITRRAIQKSLKDRLGKSARSLVNQNYQLIGGTDQHYFDIAIVNGAPLVATNSISFEVPWSKELVKQVHAAEWSIHDVQGKYKDLTLPVIVLPPKEHGEVEFFDRAVRNLESLGANVVREPAINGWAEGEASRIAGYLNRTTGYRA
jgi:hypothetical protein